MYQRAYLPSLSVDCVLIGFDGEQLCVLLIERTWNRGGDGSHDLKLPGSLIYEDEDLDDAAQRVLFELTGISQTHMQQFKTFGSPERTADPKDVEWLEDCVKLKIGRLVTVAYTALIRITGKLKTVSPEYKASWLPLTKLPPLAFDHAEIIREALDGIHRTVEQEPATLFELLPPRFTIRQLRHLYETIQNKAVDVRNFQKKITLLPYIVAQDQFEKEVSHRAARYYRFDKKTYNKRKNG